MIKQLSEAFGVSGYEREVADIITDTLTEYNLSLKKDLMGNIFAYSKPDNTPKIIVTAHMDEPGFIVTDITDDGYLKFEIIGNIETKYLLSQRVKIGDITGIISFKAIHLISKEEREKPIKTDDLLIDIGAKTAKEAKEAVLIGDYGVFDSDFQQIGKNSITSKALSGRVGCFALIELLKKAKKSNLNILGIFTVQQEMSSRGASVAFADLPKTDIAIVIDGIECNDDIKSGGGVVVGFSRDMGKKSIDISNRICKLAEENDIKYHTTVVTCKNDSDVLRSKSPDINTVYLGIACKYKKNPVNNTMSFDDIKSTLALMDEIAMGVENGTII